jgi:hypothetical protein
MDVGMTCAITKIFALLANRTASKSNKCGNINSTETMTLWGEEVNEGELIYRSVIGTKSDLSEAIHF